CAGTVEWDTVDIQTLNRDQLFSHVGILSQDFSRWPFTAQANVMIGDPKKVVNESTLADSAAYADAVEIIENLPRKWDTLLARQFSGGLELSGGQWQRIGLARAHYRSASILIYDEPTSALDPKAEIEIFEKIRALASEGHTIIIITHRLASVRHADMIFMLAHGRLIESGTHEQLLNLQGNFAQLYQLQARQYHHPQ
ncbi:ATP-binding cassette domain-containing protein, partial [Streptomyces cinereoruber]|uniref:ATP-binding cassette domain-containing protein n=1 Tax=Streptomyces cinereoruber TaxID=67260 RepID=UPI0036383329